ncbi:MAG: hypothetical protein HQL25_00670 [Candidatus Omnitrophica bacterium]|nr:hypothetical protein [Candidatus Omnitrophota bacterium]
MIKDVAYFRINNNNTIYIKSMRLKHLYILRKSVTSIVLFAFLLTNGFAHVCSAQNVVTQITLSPAFTPSLLTGVKVFPEDPFKLEFIVNKGPVKSLRDHGVDDSHSEALAEESKKLIKYFLASVTIPENDLWVNLSPTEKNRITTEAFGQTEMGRDLLAQDYILKQITSALLNPDNETGRKFWNEIYSKSYNVGARHVVPEIPTDILSKVWIVPAKAVVYEGKDSAYVVESKLKVLLETDYFTMQKMKNSKSIPRTQDEGVPQKDPSPSQAQAQDDAKLNMQLMRHIIVPVLEKEVNEGKNFAQLRQVYNSLILATWYKKKIKDSIFNAYIDQKKIAGVDISDKSEKEKIWAQYVETFKRGAYNYVKEEYDPNAQQIIAKKYFSGGVQINGRYKKAERAQLAAKKSDGAMIVRVFLDPEQTQEIIQIKDGIDLRKVVKEAFVKNPNIVLEIPGHNIRYENLQSLGFGGFGNVYAATRRSADMHDGKRVAIKTYESVGWFSSKTEVFREFLNVRSGDVAAKNFFVGVTDFRDAANGDSLDVWKNYGLLDMDYIEGTRFFELKDKQQKIRILLYVIEQMAGFFREYGVVHGDLRANNILIKSDGYPIGIDWDSLYMYNDLMDRFKFVKRDINTVGTMLLHVFDPKATLHLVTDPKSTTKGLIVQISGGENIPPGIKKIIKKAVFCREDNRFESLEDLLIDLKAALAEEMPEIFTNNNLHDGDQAMKHTGGIDLTGDKMAVQVEGTGDGIQFKFDQAMIAKIQNASGLAPVIIDIRNMNISLLQFLGVNE